jgi:DNA invertase Pin-like site-specific DNA recombinase/predicted DNA-binding transcriptional regulator AlpA
MAQVRDHTESTARQYAQVDEALRLGWTRQSVEVIDSDLGISGRSADGRPGFKDLVGRVCLGEVGAIFGLEISRLARSTADLSRLLELARLTDTLVIDLDGIYDLGNFNDRLLLGLKGTMSEAELHFLSSRLQGAKRAAAQRGELRFPLPVGLTYDDEGMTIIDPDVEVQTAVADVFSLFRAGGSAYQVVSEFKGRKFPLRAYGGVWAGQLRWGRLTHSRVLGILSNPSYAGTYVFGRYHSSRIVSPGGVISTKTVQLDLKDWPVVIYEHHQGYISWDDYLANQARLAANTTNAGARPPREGQALCQGIIFCGSCGRPMSTRYHRNGQPAYECSSARADHVSTPTCRSISTTTLDDAVVEQLLAALNPEEFALALAVADEVSDRRVCQSRALELALERAHYEAQRAERAFIACEPENRLVARSLEQRWEARLGALCEAESALATAKKAIPALPSRKDLEALSADLEKLWYQPSTSSRDRKRLLRTLIADVTLLPETDLSKAHIGIRWHSGATDELVVARAEYGRYRRTNPAAVSLAHSLADLSNHDLAEELNAAGYVTGAGRTFDNDSVAWLRYSHHIPQPKVLVDGESSVPEVAHYLGTSSATVIGWIVRGSLRARRGVNNQWCIPFDPKVQDACRALADGSVPTHRCDSSDSEASCELTIAEVADVVQVSAGTVYQWIKVGHLCARKDSKGRLFISFDPDIEVACRARVAGSVHIGCTYKKSGQ